MISSVYSHYWMRLWCIVLYIIGLSEHVKQRVQSLLDETMGGPVSAMVPENIVMIARAGSYLYGLDVAGSDVDYLIIYADPLQVLYKA